MAALRLFRFVLFKKRTAGDGTFMLGARFRGTCASCYAPLGLLYGRISIVPFVKSQGYVLELIK